MATMLLMHWLALLLHLQVQILVAEAGGEEGGVWHLLEP
jgi:hypothetical protein